MRDLLIQVLQLQLEYSHENTDPMSTRGVVIRQRIPRWIRRHQPQLAPRLGEFADQFDVAGKDGTGRKTLVPWVRIFADGMSPNPQNGWYVVYLFHPDGGAVSLCISHGSTTWDGLTFQPRPAEEAQELMDWSRGEIGDAARLLNFTPGVRLGSTAQLPRAYERTTAFSKTYPVATIPDEQVLLADLGDAIELLRALYDAAAAGRQPRAFQRDVVELNAEINELINPNRRRRGQGFGLNAVQRRAVDARAMLVAREWLEANAFTRIRDVSLREPCDYRAQFDGVEKVVEVKGTTGGPFTILLTKGEVDLHRQAFPNNLLLIVHGIQLNGDVANGGEVEAHNPWQVFEEALTATAFRYTFPE
ncbi:DUF3578 domain-containing protein [Agrobacterium sp. S2/73]|uniref:MrcB family domain-containing protein n=1 Tax=unclassified Agrobacterium TaxID=2632611 RepID=UPI001ADCAFBB|nr:MULTISPECIES: DUF3578 domain-containing protein [unclassified Agrobacterium]MBO9108920.1 DUF3578 domain-containing protein [Agrobacterium sp. S2/73]QXZ73330.1 DUF3578 domain-containing protein [Agrobacterium sp. S7/73]